MKKIAVAVALSLGALTACGGGSGEPTPTETVIVTQSPEATQTQEPVKPVQPNSPRSGDINNPRPQEEDYISYVASQMSSDAMRQSAQQFILDLGYAACSDYDAGSVPADIIAALRESPLTSQFTAAEQQAITDGSFNFLCPEYAEGGESA